MAGHSCAAIYSSIDLDGESREQGMGCDGAAASTNSSQCEVQPSAAVSYSIVLRPPIIDAECMPDQDNRSANFGEDHLGSAQSVCGGCGAGVTPGVSLNKNGLAQLSTGALVKKQEKGE